MKEILKAIPLWFEIKKIIEYIIDHIPMFATIAAIGAIIDFKGTVHFIQNVLGKIADLIDRRRVK